MSRYLSATLAAALLWVSGLFFTAQAQVVLPPNGPPTSIACAYNSSLPTLTNGQVGWAQCDSQGKLFVDATVNASVSGFAPSGNYATLTAPSGSSSAATLLPTGSPTEIIVYNNGAFPASVLLGGSGVTATANNDIVPAGGALALGVGSNTYIAGYGVGGSAALVVSGGAGLGNSFSGDSYYLSQILTGVNASIPAGTNSIGSLTTQYPGGSTPQTASATGTTAATTATLAGTAAQYTFLCGFSIRANATAAATGNATVTGTVTGTLNFTQWTAPLASGLGVTEEIFTPCVPSASTGTSQIAVVSAAPGSGGIVSVSAWGYTKATSP